MGFFAECHRQARPPLFFGKPCDFWQMFVACFPIIFPSGGGAVSHGLVVGHRGGCNWGNGYTKPQTPTLILTFLKKVDFVSMAEIAMRILNGESETFWQRFQKETLFGQNTFARQTRKGCQKTDNFKGFLSIDAVHKPPPAVRAFWVHGQNWHLRTSGG